MTGQREVGRRRRQERREQQKRLCRTMFALCLLAFLLGVLCGRLAFAKEKTVSGQEETGGEEDAGAMAGGAPGTAGGALSSGQADKADWRLTLVNASHPLEDGYVPELAEIENNYYFDARAVGALQDMLADGRKEGLDFWVCSAYRTIEKQTELYEDKVRRLEAEGMSRQEALSGAAAVVAYPGTSEHNLGLAVDIVARDYQLLDERQEETAEQQWLMKNCWRYGFILRYPTDKTEETGIIYEPWHYRYVGREAAEEITRQEICLEEYLGYESSQLPEGTGQGDTEAYRGRPDAASSAA